jgi:hypothetical protein
MDNFNETRFNSLGAKKDHHAHKTKKSPASKSNMLYPGESGNQPPPFHLLQEAFQNLQVFIGDMEPLTIDWEKSQLGWDEKGAVIQLIFTCCHEGYTHLMCGRCWRDRSSKNVKVVPTVEKVDGQVKVRWQVHFSCMTDLTIQIDGEDGEMSSKVEFLFG